MGHYELEIYRKLPAGPNFEYGWGRLNTINDLWACLGWLINELNFQITFTTLEYFNEIFEQSFNGYLECVIEEKNGIIARFEGAFQRDRKYYIQVVRKGDK